MQKNPKDKNQGEDFNFWQPATDLMTGLVFILMLLVTLLGLFLLYTPAEEQIEVFQEQEEQENIEANLEEEESENQEEDMDIAGGEDGQGGEEEEIYETAGGGYPEDEGIKSAVLVELVDAETGRTIKKSGVDFELYGNGEALQILNTYYPKKVSYRIFSTTKEGIFYLPEKIMTGDYYLHQLTEPEGYDAAENQHFSITKLYDWPEPYVVKVPISPSKNVIRIQMKDTNTGHTVGNSIFQVIAAEDISTQDGTVRYKEGETADEIICDEKGYGESKELYLGSYILKQKTIPEYYTGMQDEQKVSVEKKSKVEPKINEIFTEKTEICLNLSDELYPEIKIEGVSYQITHDGKTEIFKTDVAGNIYFTDLEKDTTYYIQQKSAAGEYLLDTKKYKVVVEDNGRIDGKAKEDLNLTNRIYRVQINTVDKILQRNKEKVKLSLYTKSGMLVETWDTEQESKQIDGIKTGSYYIIVDENQEKKYEFQIKDTKEIQEWEVEVISIEGIMAVVFLAIIFVAIFISAGWGIKKWICGKKVRNEE